MTNSYLILILQAPLVAYGNEAVDRKRPTDLMPGRSMLTGLLGNAIGYSRRDAAELDSLQKRLRYAARTEQFGHLRNLRDFHTAQLSADDVAWTTYGVPEGRSGSPDTYRSPEIREVDYLTESRTVVAITLDDTAEGPTLGEIAAAVQKPARPLFIGRKCCLPERPIFEAVLDAADETEALYLVPNAPEIMEAQAQWDGPHHHNSIRKDREVWVSDLKDWHNGVHVGRRMVNRGQQRFKETLADIPGV
ncbi:MAG: type I-E CRISPR-associated protein Cas5/CasD [Chloroflexi bacterium]|nr:type I-E CRISPR-associated protein Cas5/CasD [Chloroflexota bacterium]